MTNRWKAGTIIGLAAVVISCGTLNQAAEHQRAATGTTEFAPDSTIVQMTTRALNTIQYLNNEITMKGGPEWIGCLNGRVDGDVATVTHISMPYMKDAKFGSVTYFPCDEPTYIGTVHPHFPIPGVPCGPSEVDEASYANDTRARLHMIVCGNTLVYKTYNEGEQ